MKASEVNPRVLLWAQAEGYGIDSVLERLDNPEAETPRTPKGQLWTVEFMAWVQARWREFHTTQHGAGDHHDCITCRGATEDGSFDRWLEAWVREAA